MEIIGDKITSNKYIYGCNLNVLEKKYLGQVISNKREFTILEAEKNIGFTSMYRCNSLMQKVFSYGFYDIVDSEGITIFQLHKYGFLKSSTKLISSDGNEYKIPMANSFLLPTLGIGIMVNRTKLRTTVDDQSNIALALCLSYFCWLRQQIWDNSV